MPASKCAPWASANCGAGPARRSPTRRGSSAGIIGRRPQSPARIRSGRARAADDNVEVRRWGQPRKFDFEPKAHWDLGPDLGILDLERAAKITGARFAVYWGIGRAAGTRADQLHSRRAHARASRLHRSSAAVPDQLGQPVRHRPASRNSRRTLFKIENTDFWLAPTAEVPVTNLYRDETLICRRAPHQAVRLHAVLPQRSGLLRARCARHHPPAPVSESGAGEIHAARTELRRTRKTDRRRRRHSEAPGPAVPHAWSFPPAILGASSAKTYDLEVWLPGQNGYKEISSCSNFEAFQARRASIRAKSGKGQGRIRSHAERQRAGRGPHLGGDRRKLPAGRWQRNCSRSPSAICRRRTPAC